LNTHFKPVYSRRFGLLRVIDHGLNLPDETYILHSPAIEKILFDRSLVNWPLQIETYRAARAFFEALKDGVLKKYPPGTRFEQVNLAGSDDYQLQSAHAKVFNSSLPRNYIALHREVIENEYDEEGKQKFRSVISYKRFEARGKLCILGETIATGISACDSLREHMPYAIKHGLEMIIIFSIAGSKVGAQRVYEVLREYNIKSMFVFGLGLFGLGKDGTALLWKDAEGLDNPITLPEYEKKGNEIFLPGECCIGDWGRRFTDHEGYLREWKDELARLGHPERFRMPEEYKDLYENRNW